jgi:hypothetical protein
VTDWLSDEWLDAAQAGLSSVQFPELDARIQFEVTDVRGGDQLVHAILQGGGLVGLAPGRLEDAGLTLTVAVADARALCEGTLQPSVAFMQGRMKVAGSMGVLLALLLFASTPTGRAARERLLRE